MMSNEYSTQEKARCFRQGNINKLKGSLQLLRHALKVISAMK